MGKYDGPHFEAEGEGIVSVWIATVPFDAIPDDYWIYDFEGDDDAAWNRFSSDFGFGYYDDDFVDSNCDDEHRSVPIRDLVTACSYGASFVEVVVKRAAELGLTETSYVYLMYNFRYDPTVTGIERSPYLRFLGVFEHEEP
jgi:hypothetical protein